MRVKGGFKRRRSHKKVFDLTKGYQMSRSTLIRSASSALLHAGEYAFHGRKRKKRDFRTLWISRLNAFLKEMQFKYKDFIFALKNKNIELDRKVLAKMAVEHPEAMSALVKKVMS